MEYSATLSFFDLNASLVGARFSDICYAQAISSDVYRDPIHEQLAVDGDIDRIC